MAGTDSDAVDAPTVKTLGRGLEVLTLFGSLGPELSQRDIALATSLPMPTVYRLVRTLVAREFLELVPQTRNYRLGPEMLRLSSPLLGRFGSAQGVREGLRELSMATGETTSLATLVGSEILYLDGVVGTRFLTPGTSVGRRLSAHSTALGKCLLAQLSDEEVLERLGPGPYEQLTPLTACTWSQLKERLDEVRAARGVAISEDEYEVGLTAVAIALARPPHGEQRAINVALPSARATPEFRDDIIAQLRVFAALIETAGASPV